MSTAIQSSHSETNPSLWRISALPPRPHSSALSRVGWRSWKPMKKSSLLLFSVASIWM